MLLLESSTKKNIPLNWNIAQQIFINFSSISSCKRGEIFQLTEVLVVYQISKPSYIMLTSFAESKIYG